MLCVNHQGCHICCVSLWREGNWETLCCEGLEENRKLSCDYKDIFIFPDIPEWLFEVMFIISSTQIDKKIVRTEIGVLLRLSHPNIVRYLCSITLFTLWNISRSLYSVRIWMSSFWRDCSNLVFFQIRLKEIFETVTEIFLILELVTGGELFDRYEVLMKGSSNVKQDFWHSSSP